MKRLLSSTVYIASIVVAFLLREFVDYRFFYVLIFALAGLGSFELFKVTKAVVNGVAGVSSLICGWALVPVMTFGELFISGSGWIFGLGLIGLSLLVSLISHFAIKNPNHKLLLTVINALYPAICIFLMVLCNQQLNDRGFIALVLLFVISGSSDTMAFYSGILIKGPKLAPRLSPNKTWAGAIGGVLGGAVGSLLVYLVFARPVGLFNWWIFLLIGAVGSAVSMVGDLFESFIKRRLGIKDISNIMPGHGGILDRIDGLLFVPLVVFPIMLIL